MAELFADVVVFDTTYCANKYNLPFAPFVGVNHHGQMILLGGALLQNEQTDMFKYIFKHWKKAARQSPKTLITDQDRAISEAIKRIFPDAVHVYCIWHIACKFPLLFSAKLGS